MVSGSQNKQFENQVDSHREHACIIHTTVRFHAHAHTLSIHHIKSPYPHNLTPPFPSPPPLPGPAHMGHAYEGLTADMIARYYRIASPSGCYFVTGSDEHGQKIAGVAESQGMEPIQLTDKYVDGFNVLNQREVRISWRGRARR
jgi:hypothetical protein